MKRRLSIGVMVCIMISFLSLTAIADGGREEALGICKTPPTPTNESPLINGTFTATRFRLEKAYSIQCVLKMSRWVNEKEVTSKEKTMIPEVLKGKEKEITYIHTFEKVIRENIPLCNYTEQELFQKYWPRPCNVGIQKQFNLQGFPVLTELKILSKSDCENEELAAIQGSFKIRVIPQQKNK